MPIPSRIFVTSYIRRFRTPRQIVRRGQNAYLVQLMKSTAEGDVLAVKNHESHRTQSEAQGCDIKVIREKIVLLALVNMVFLRRASDERNIKFEDIASRLETIKLSIISR